METVVNREVEMYPSAHTHKGRLGSCSMPAMPAFVEAMPEGSNLTSCSMAHMRWVDSSSSRLMCMWKGIWRRRSSFSCSGVLSWYLQFSVH